MKNYIYILAFCAVSMLFASSCVSEQKDIFEDSSANRLTKAAKDYTDLLTSSEDGWVMEYFANENEQGYTMLMKFDKNGAVTVAGKNKWIQDKYKSDKSLWKMIIDAGPVLSLNTYNTVFHVFSDPNDIVGTEDDETGRGHEGDYEFVMMSNDGNNITLKGKKHGLTAYMHRLPAGANWEEYFANLDNVKNSLFTNKIPTLLFTAANGEKFSITNSTTGVFSLVPEGGDPISQTIPKAFIVLPTGIRMLTPFKGDKETFSVQNFEIAENGALVCTEDGVSTIVAPKPLELFQDKTLKWRIDPNKMNGLLATAYNDVKAAVKSKFGQTLQYVQFMYSKEGYKLQFKSGSSTGNFDGVLQVDGENLTIKYDGSGDKNADNYLKTFKEFQGLLDALNASTFEFSTSSIMCPTEIKMGDKADKDNYYYLTVQ